MVDDIATNTDWSALYIDNEWTESESGESIAVEDPSARETATHTPHEAETDIDAAYGTAAEVQESWAEASPTRRQEVVERFPQTLSGYGGKIIDLLAREVGGSRVMGETFIQIVSNRTSETATLPRRIHGEHAASNIPDKGNIVQKNPKDVMTVISPWSFPLNLSMWAVAPAVAAGNTVVLKPSTNPPIASGLLFVRLFEETGLLRGIVSVITGCDSEINDRVASYPESDMVAFISSTEVGKRVSGITDEDFTMPTMEFGGSNAHVVTEDVDIGRAADTAVFGNFAHQGQVCISIDRHIVHESAYSEHVEKLTERATELLVGSAREDDTVAGPVIDGSRHDEMLGCVEETVTTGATLETGGSAADLDDVDDSPVIQLTALPGVTSGMAAAHDKYFGPIALVIPFPDIGEAVEFANTTGYSLSGSARVGNLATGKETAPRIGTGNVHTNDQLISDETYVSFGSIRVPGVGTHNSDAFLDGITEDKWISLQYEPRDYPL